MQPRAVESLVRMNKIIMHTSLAPFVIDCVQINISFDYQIVATFLDLFTKLASEWHVITCTPDNKKNIHYLVLIESQTKLWPRTQVQTNSIYVSNFCQVLLQKILC